MGTPRYVVSIVLCAFLLTACSATAGPPPSPSPSTSTSSEPVVLGGGEKALEAGTYRMEPSVLALAPYPALLVTVPKGWTSSDGWALHKGPVGISLWNVNQAFGHPCQWKGTAFSPGKSVDELVAALVAVPLRNPTTPEPVEIDGRTGLYFEWSVPADIAHDGEGFPDCDAQSGEPHDFVSWTGTGTPSIRYHQGPGQVDRVWTLDTDGERLVIDAYSMPEATEEEIAEIHEIVSSIRFIDE